MTKSELAPKYKYRLQFVPSALAEWQVLDGSVKEPLRKLPKLNLNALAQPKLSLEAYLDSPMWPA